MNNPLSYWIWLGIIYLGILTFQDYKNLMEVDDRHNYFMLGATQILYVPFPKTFLYVLILILGTMILYWILKKLRVLGEADIKSLSWMFYGFGIIGWGDLFYLLMGIIIIFIIYNLIKLKAFKLNEPTPFYLCLLINFVLTSMFLGFI